MPTRSSIRHPVFVVVIVATAVRLWMMAGLPLVITNDGFGYLHWAEEYFTGAKSSIPPLRTPGYPLFLAGVFHIFGPGPFGVLLAQHALGIGTAAIIAAVTARRHGTRWALAMGILAALSPTLICWERYALTEPLATFLMAAALALVFLPRGTMSTGLSLGLLLGFAALVRPSIELWVPTLGLGWLWRMKAGFATKLRGAVAFALGLAVTLSPWLVHNAQRGIYGLATGERTEIWYGLRSSDLLDDSYPLPPNIAAAYSRLRSVPKSETADFQFLSEIAGWDDKAVGKVLGDWSLASIKARPGRYTTAVGSLLASQLDLAPNDFPWFLWRLSVNWRDLADSRAAMPSTDRRILETFDVPGGRGSVSKLAAWTANHGIPGLPQAPLFAGAVIVGLGMLARRDWGGALIMAGTGALFIVPTVLLLPSPRLVVSSWASWMIVLPDACKDVCSLWRCRSRRGSHAPLAKEP